MRGTTVCTHKLCHAKRCQFSCFQLHLNAPWSVSETVTVVTRTTGLSVMWLCGAVVSFAGTKTGKSTLIWHLAGVNFGPLFAFHFFF